AHLPRGHRGFRDEPRSRGLPTSPRTVWPARLVARGFRVRGRRRGAPDATDLLAERRGRHPGPDSRRSPGGPRPRRGPGRHDPEGSADWTVRQDGVQRSPRLLRAPRPTGPRNVPGVPRPPRRPRESPLSAEAAVRGVPRRGRVRLRPTTRGSPTYYH